MMEQIQQPPLVPKGYFLLARTTFESSIWYKPPHYIKIWVWLLGKANHKEQKSSGRIIYRGQCFTTYAEIIADHAWYVGSSKRSLTKGKVRSVIDFLREESMISTSKSTRGILITINNYQIYQEAHNYEYHTPNNTPIALRRTSQQHTINKNVKKKETTYTNEETAFARKIAEWACTRAKSPSRKSKEEYKKAILPYINTYGFQTIGEIFSKQESNYDFWIDLKALKGEKCNNDIDQKIKLL